MVTESLKKIGINVQKAHRNLDSEELHTHAENNSEGSFTKDGVLVVNTGKYTGRSPNDKFLVDDPRIHDKVNWGKVNVPITIENYEKLFKKVTDHLSEKEKLYVFDGMAGADLKHTYHIRVVNEFAWQNLFIRSLLRRPSDEELEIHDPVLTILAAPGCKIDNPKDHGLTSEAFIILNLAENIVLIGGSHYAGEIKKSIFSYLNYVLPEKGVFPMHCSANIGESGDVALFFGLSGTGKTTISNDPQRKLLGDDEHGWSEDGIFNFEGGCYAKCINLTRETEPTIWDAIKRGAVMENVVVDKETGIPDFTDNSLTENTRVGYPLEYASNAILTGTADHPKAIVFLTADAFGVLPPVARLSPKQAMYHFITGYTSKLAGTERGIVDPIAVFSSFFGEPFMPQHPMVYCDLLEKYLQISGAKVFLINTGWTKGPYGTGERISIDWTRKIVTAALNGNLDNCSYVHNIQFNLDVPTQISGVPKEIMNPRDSWADQAAYDVAAKKLADLFNENFSKLGADPELAQFGPRGD